MKPNLRNLFMKKLTRGRVVPIISASVSWLIFVVIGSGRPSLPKFASSRRVRARRLSLELKDADHLRFLEAHHRRDAHRSSRRQPQRLGNQTAFAEKVPLAKQADYRFPPVLGGHGDFDLAPHDIEDRVGSVSLREDDLSHPIFRHGSAVAHSREECSWIK